MQVNNLVDFGTACPSQWEGKSVKGQYVYIRYRYGSFSVSIAQTQVYQKTIGDNMDGVMSTSDMLRLLSLLPNFYVVKDQVFMIPDALFRQLPASEITPLLQQGFRLLPQELSYGS